MELHVTAEQQAHLAQIALKVGTDAEHLVRDAALRLLEDEDLVRLSTPELPVPHLGVRGFLHRRDIYSE